MKKLLLLLCAGVLLTMGLSSCVAGKSMKRDCQGGKHVKLKNGVWI